MFFTIGGTVQPACYGATGDEHISHDIWHISIHFGK